MNPIKKSIQNQKNIVDFGFKDDLLYYHGLLYIPLGSNQFKVLQRCHDFFEVGHFGFNKTMELISRDYWLPRMWKFVKEIIKSYNVCTRAKVPHH